MLYRVHKKIEIKATLTVAWKFFSDPTNLKFLTPPSLKMQITSPVESEIYPGMIIVYKVHPILSIPLTWVTEITHVERERLFVDEQRYGPYKLWHHQHFFKETSQGVLIEDVVDYILPFGVLGRVAHAVMVSKQLEDIFSFRAEYLRGRFGAIDAET